jgi:hypothetical protein
MTMMIRLGIMVILLISLSCQAWAGGVMMGGGVAAEAGVTAGEFTYSGTATGDGTLTVSLVRATSAGDLIVIWVKWEGATGTNEVSVTGDDSGSTWVKGTLVTNTVDSNNLHGQFIYTLSAAGAGTGVTVTMPANGEYSRAILMNFTKTGTASMDVQNTGTGTGTTLTTGQVTTTGAKDVCLGSYGEYSATASSSETIGGSARAAVSSASNSSSMWYRILASTMTNGTSSATVGEPWIGNIICFKSAL